ncbi:3-isopropylmalate dehydratase small subunit, partial [Pantoea endophytica]
MEAFNNMTGTLAPLPAANIDTDVIMPKQFLKGIDRKNLDRGVFFDLRFLPDGRPNPAFILNQVGWENAAFLL